MRSPSPDGLVKRIVRIEEQIRQLRLRPQHGLMPEMQELAPFFYDPAITGRAWETAGSYPENAGWYVHAGRCWLHGVAAWVGDGNEAQYLVGPSSRLPVETRPAGYETINGSARIAQVTIPLHGDSSGFNPLPLKRNPATGELVEISGGDSGWFYYGASTIATAHGDSTGTYIQFQNGVQNGGRLFYDETTPTEYDGVPDGTFLLLDGISWAVS